MWKWIIGTVIFLVVVAGGGVAAILASGKVEIGGMGNSSSKQSGLEVQIRQVETGKLTRVVSAPGSIEPRKKVEISAQGAANWLNRKKFEGGPCHT